MNNILTEQTKGKALLSVALGCCLAGSEARQYTAVFDYGVTKPIELVALSMIVVLAGFACAIFFFKKDRSLLANITFVGILSACQTTSLVVQSFDAIGLVPHEALAAASPLGECNHVLFVFLAIAAAQTFAEKSIVIYIASFATAGFLQFIAAIIKWEISLLFVCTLPLLSFGFVIWFLARRPCNLHATPDSRKILQRPAWKPFRFETAAFLLNFFLMGALLVSTHATRMDYQDGGVLSFSIQALSGLAGIVTAGALLIVHRKLAGMGKVALAYLLVLTVLLSALYLTSLFQNFVVLVLLIFLHRFAYGLVYFFLWFLCASPDRKQNLAPRFIVSFAVLKLGWAAGVLSFMTLPALWDAEYLSALPIVFFFAMVVVDIYLFAHMSNPVPIDQDRSAPSTSYEQACLAISEEFGLTRRESEALPLLGRGRTSSYIQKEMVISSGTARTHIDHIYKKLGIHSQQELIDVIEAEQVAQRH